MSLHNYTVFKNSCIKTPINPSSRLPTPFYERIRSATSLNESGFSKSLNNLTKNIDGGYSENFKEKDTPKDSNTNFMSLIDFYESIPGKKFFFNK